MSGCPPPTVESGKSFGRILLSFWFVIVVPCSLFQWISGAWLMSSCLWQLTTYWQGRSNELLSTAICFTFSSLCRQMLHTIFDSVPLRSRGCGQQQQQQQHPYQSGKWKHCHQSLHSVATVDQMHSSPACNLQFTCIAAKYLLSLSLLKSYVPLVDLATVIASTFHLFNIQLKPDRRDWLNSTRFLNLFASPFHSIIPLFWFPLVQNLHNNWSHSNATPERCQPVNRVTLISARLVISDAAKRITKNPRTHRMTMSADIAEWNDPSLFGPKSIAPNWVGWLDETTRNQQPPTTLLTTSYRLLINS